MGSLAEPVNTISMTPILSADRHCARYKLSYRIVSTHLP